MIPNNQSKEKRKLNDVEAYKIALETRNMEIGLFWQRSNYFLVLNAALAVGFFRLTDNTYAILLATLGIFISFLWYRVNLGSKYWQARWEHRLNLKECEVYENLDFFSASPDLIQKDVEESFNHGFKNKGCIQKWIEKQVLKKPSVSYNMILLSLVFLASWLLLIIIRVFSNA